MAHTNHDEQLLELVPARSKGYRTLCDLPVELITLVFSHIRDDKQTLRACSLTCPCLRATTIEPVLTSTTHLRVLKLAAIFHLTTFLKVHPDMCKNIQGLKLSGEMYVGETHRLTPRSDLCASTIAQLLKLLPNLKSLEIGCFTYPPLSRLYSPCYSGLIENTFGPVHLDFFSFSLSPSERHHTSSIPGLFLILCMISSIGELDARNLVGGVNPLSSLTPRLLQRPLIIKTLRLNGAECSDRGCQCATTLIESFARAIVPGSLQNFEARCSSISAVIVVGELLKRVGGELTSLDVGGAAPSCEDDRAKWDNPFDRHWHWINLSSCPWLESIVIHIYYRAPSKDTQPRDVRPLSRSGVSMLSDAPRLSRLRQVTIYLYDVPSLSAFGDARMLGLGRFDDLLTQSHRFPALEEVILKVEGDEFSSPLQYDWWDIINKVEEVLPALNVRHLLSVEAHGW